jgi:hypothetical protein
LMPLGFGCWHHYMGMKRPYLGYPYADACQANLGRPGREEA